ncbi:SWIM zinc finger family protein [Gordonia soli]|uniref:SWIM-type domain-containing protein n=1 Tax=Gordonia soli NBRC 108243 TaxID=1223545 RepID=M0QMX4_9ACTN|nr:SWIM zinc finger family protein [Gordonia soli]GAC69908.1 hypothetical protein GS4_29_00070 [Gordonia soli NBRC 108243]
MTGATAEFGYTLWGADIVRLAEPLSTRRPDPLLPRARSLARNGGVTLDVDGRVVGARVHRGGEASVTQIEFVPMSPAVAATLRELLGARTDPDDEAYRASTAAGRSPTIVLDAADCSCTARTDRCLHVLATLYALSRAVDEQPHLALALQDYSAPRDTPTDDGPPPRWIPLSAVDVGHYWS